MTVLNSLAATDDQRSVWRDRADALSVEARENWDDPTWRRLMAQALTETIFEGFQHENILDLFSTVERVGETGRIFIKEARGMRAFWTAKGGYIEASTLRVDVAELERDMIGWHVYEFDDKLRNDFATTANTLIDLATQRLDAEVNIRALKMFQLAVPSSSPYYVSGAGVSLASIDAAINEVWDTTNDTTVTILGRRTMTGQIVDLLTAGNYGAFLPNTNEDLLRRGVLGTYKGATITTLRNFKDDEDVSFFPANEMWVIGRDASKFGFWGGPHTQDWTDHNWYWNHLSRQDFGGAVYRPDRLRRIVDTSLAP